MRIKHTIARFKFFATLAICLGVGIQSSYGELTANQPYKGCPCRSDTFSNEIFNKVRSCVDYNKNIPNKKDIYILLSKLERSKYIAQEGNGNFPMQFVLAQGCIEHVLTCSQILGEITDLVGVIHAPMPATPLCTNLNDPLLGQPLDASIAQDQDKLLTVRSRTQNIRDYLEKGGKLFVAYPKGGLEKRTEEQQNFYLNAVNQYQESLIDTVLNCDQMNPEMTGATYIFKNQENWYAFSIKAHQAANPQENSEWALWFGKVNHPAIKARVNAVCDYLIENQGPDIRTVDMVDSK